MVQLAQDLSSFEMTDHYFFIVHSEQSEESFRSADSCIQTELLAGSGNLGYALKRDHDLRSRGRLNLRMV